LDSWAAAVDKDQAAKPTVHAKSLDSSDGVRTLADYDFYTPHAARSADGRLWFLPSDGVSVVDPRHLPFNRLVPQVRIEQVTANHKTYDVPSDGKASLGLPARVRDLQIDYTALSLVAPEKVRFRYRLEGYDREWQDAGNRRQAFYTNLRPRNYRFSVIACNNSGVWNEAGAALDFSVAPTYYQTLWFQVLGAAAFLALVWLLHRYRVHQIAREFNARLEGRVDERLRVSRELHDTLLQSFQASLIQMQAARDLFSRRPPQAAQNLDDAISMAAGAIAEGRGAIQGLRSQPPVQDDLVKVLTVTGQDLARSQEGQDHPVSFRLEVEGEQQPLEPLLQDEVSRIARELLRNAFRHSQARQIEAEIRYDPNLLRVHVRDDGKGIHPEILKAGGRDGHWGLAGMRERAQRIGARLDFWSEAGAGTEVQLTVAASIAYQTNHQESRSWLLRRKRVSS
jgi:signal transduction histidine kinase